MTSVASPILLLIASHPQFIYLIERYGERSGCQIRSADSVEKAVECLRRERVAMVLVHLSGWPHDGWTMLQAMKPHCATTSVPIVIISAVADEARARAEGAACWLWQPVMYDDFCAALMAARILTEAAAPAGTLVHNGGEKGG